MIPTARLINLSAAALALSSWTLAASPCAATEHAADPGTPVAKLEGSRVSGAAPLAVLFDATGTTAPPGLDAFRELTYTFDFGDEKGRTWEHSGLPRNTQTGGPLVAHVFDTPGTYTVRLHVQTAGGASSDTSVLVTVENSDTVFPGEKTVCVSAAKAYSDCPTGALRETELPRTYAGKRVLLNRGETFGTISINRNNDGIMIGSYGNGPKPIVQDVFINSGRLNDKSADDVTIMDLDVSNGIQHSGSGSRYLFYRNDLTRPGGNNAIEIGGALDYLASQNPRVPFYIPREIFIVDNVIIGQVNRIQKPLLNLAGQGAYFVIMGNDISRAEQHTVRLYAIHKGFIAHNALRGQSQSDTGGSIRSVLKIHSGGLLPYSDNWADTKGAWATSQLVIADNLMGDEKNNGFFTAGVAPQNRDPGTTEGIEDVIIERNRFIRGPYTNTEMENLGRRVTTRGNTRVDGGVPNLSIAQPSPSLPPDWAGPYYRQ
jgi:PKD repeat protein